MIPQIPRKQDSCWKRYRKSRGWWLGIERVVKRTYPLNALTILTVAIFDSNFS